MEDLAWYVLYTAPSSEKRAMENVEQVLKVATFMPRRRIETIRRGKKRVAIKTVFPRYVFMGVDGDADRCWFKLPDIPGVCGVLTMDHRPWRLQSEIVGDLMSASALWLFDPPSRHSGMNEGASVKILTGPFARFTATIASLEKGDRAKVTLRLFGREMPTIMPLDDLRLVS